MLAIILSGLGCLIGLIIFLIGLDEPDENISFSGAAIGIVSLVLGFGIICGLMPVGKETYEILVPTEIAKSPARIFVKAGNEKTLETSDVTIYNANEKDIRVKRTDRHNAYGGKLDDSYEIVLDDVMLEKK